MSTETTQDLLDNNKTCQVGDVVVVRYIKLANKIYITCIQAVSYSIFAQFLKRSGEKTFSIKDGDTDDSVSIENIKMKLKSVSINSVVEDNLQVNLDSSSAKWLWFDCVSNMLLTCLNLLKLCICFQVPMFVYLKYIEIFIMDKFSVHYFPSVTMTFSDKF